jgi:hypothetical protein
MDFARLAVGGVVLFGAIATGISVFASAAARSPDDERVPATARDPSRDPAPLLACIKARRSVFPKSYVAETVRPEVLRRLLEAAMWAPFHGSVPPWCFVVLGKKAMVEMQHLTLAYYDANWREVTLHRIALPSFLPSFIVLPSCSTPFFFLNIVLPSYSYSSSFFPSFFLPSYSRAGVAGSAAPRMSIRLGEK